MTEILSPKNTITRIDSCWIAVSVDEDGLEGVCSILMNGVWWPLIAADEKRLPFVLEQAEALAKANKSVVEVVRLSTRTALQRFDGRH